MRNAIISLIFRISCVIFGVRYKYGVEDKKRLYIEKIGDKKSFGMRFDNGNLERKALKEIFRLHL